jgi:zinc protease
MGDWRLYFVHRDRMEQVTSADVQRVAAKYLQAANRTVGMFIPSEKPGLVSIPDTSGISALVADYRGRPPIAEAESFDFSYANIEARTRRSTIARGVRSALVPKKSRDQEINLMLWLHHGTAENLKSVRYPASLLPSLLSRGTRQLSFQKFRDELERIESSLNTFGGASVVMLSLRTKRPHLPAALELVRQVLREPLLDAGELEIIRQQRLASLEEQRTQPESLAGRHLNGLLYPYPSDDIRYQPTIDEQVERIKAVTIEQVRDVYRQFLGTMEGELTIVGDFDPEPTLAALEKLLAGWKAEKEYARIKGRAFLDVPGGRFSISTPDKANAMYQAGLTIDLDDRDVDYPALVLGNFILGGGVSRLEERVREKDGFSYGVGSNLFANAEDKLTSFTIYAICNPINSPKVELAVAEELERLLKDGIPEEELAKAKEAWSKLRVVARSTDQGITNHLYRSLRASQSLVEFDAALEEKVKALTAVEVHSALKKHIDPKRLVVVVAGDFEKTNGK